MRGKRESEEEFDWTRINFKRVGIVSAILIVIIAGIMVAVNIANKPEENKENTETNTVVEEKKMQTEVEGYSVLGKIYIEKIGVEQYILDSTENDAMEKGAVKLYGETLNQEGNFCIAGHNYEEIFGKLTELEIGDEFYIEDIDENIQDYKITEILEVEPTDLNCLRPVKDKIQVTLITCKDGATERLVLKAERIEIEE